MANTYTDELKRIVDRTVMKGNMAKEDARDLSSIIWRIDQRLQALENQVVIDDKPAVDLTVAPVSHPTAEEVREQAPVKRGRGRPRKDA